MSHPNDANAQKLKILTYEPLLEVNVYEGYYIGGYVFHTEGYGETRATWNSGVNLKGTIDYYGVLKEVIELKYVGGNNVVLFNCVFRDSIRGIKKHPTFDLIDVKDSSRHRGDDTFILASQAQQVYMTPYPYRLASGQGWWAVWKTKARSVIDIKYEATSATNSSSLEGCYQEDEMPEMPNVDQSNDPPADAEPHTPNVGVFEEVLPVDLPPPPPPPGQLALMEVEYNSEEDDIGSESDSESDDDDDDVIDLEFERIIRDVEDD